MVKFSKSKKYKQVTRKGKKVYVLKAEYKKKKTTKRTVRRRRK